MAMAVEKTNKVVESSLETRRWASSLGVKPVLELSDISSEFDPQFDVVWCRQRGVIPLRDGIILAGRSEFVPMLKKRMQERGYTKIMVYPTLPALVEQKINDIGKSTSAHTTERLHESEVQQKIDAIIARAAAEDVSDIHLVVRPDGTRLYHNQHGAMKPVGTFTASLGIEIASVLFNVAADAGSGKSVYNPRVPSDAAMMKQFGSRIFRVRLASMPAHPEGSVHVTLRLLATNSKVESLDALGYTEEHIRLIRGALARVHGMILIAGPTGSGKTTTLAAMMTELPRDETTYSIEDPVEYVIPGVTQIPANNSVEELSFANILRGLLRMGPRNIMVGEIRDPETAKHAVSAAMTGHRMLSTIHADSARNIITRLHDLGSEYSVLSDPDLLVALVFQRLVPKVCQHCSFLFEPNYALFEKAMPELVRRLEDSIEGSISKVRIRNPKGCNFCRQTGVLGRTVVAEVIYPDVVGRAFIRNGDLSSWEEHLRKNSWTPLRSHLIGKIESGNVCPIDAEKIAIGSLAEELVGASFNYETEIMRLGNNSGPRPRA